jgi:uncharacterized membrane protein
MNKRYLSIICLVIFFTLLGKLIYENTILPISHEVAINTMIGKGEKKLSVSSSDTIRQSFIASEDIQGIYLFFSEKEKPLDNGNINIEIIDEKEDKVLFEKVIDVSKVEVEQKCPVSFDKRVPLDKGNKYYIQISSDIDKGRLFAYTKNTNREGCHLSVNMREREDNLSFGLILARDNSFLKYFVIIIIVMIVILIALIYWLIYFKHMKSLEIIYLISVLILGIIYVFVMKPNGVPDEANHYYTAYARSNEIMLFEESELSDCDESDVINADSNLEAYRALYDCVKGIGFQATDNQDRPVAVAAPAYLYFFSGMGITIGRLMGIGNILTFYLGRIFNLFFFAFTTFYAVKKIPFYKMGLVTICLFPMTMHLAASYSYDAIINGTAFLFIAYVFDIIYNSKVIAFKDCALLFITGLIIVSSKSGAYIPICLLVAFIPKQQFLKIKRKMVNLALLIGWGGWYIWQSLSATKNVVGGDFYVGWADEKAYRLDTIIGNPLHSIYVMENTLWEYTDEWLTNIVGKSLGWFDVPIPNIIVFLFLLIFLISIIKAEEIDVNSRLRWGLIALSCVSAGLVIGGMWLGWTPQSDEVIRGVQGRYFLPVLPMSIYFLQNNMLSLKRKIDNEIMIMLSVLEGITICNILVVVLK